MINRIVASILVCFSSALCAAQSIPPPQPESPTPPGAPIDGGLLILFSVAFVFGVYTAIRLSQQPTKTTH